MLNVISIFQVWAAVPPWKQGSLAEFVKLTEYEVSYRVCFISAGKIILTLQYITECLVHTKIIFVWD